MKTKWLSVAVFASVGMIAQANPGGFHAGTGASHGGAVAHRAPAVLGRSPAGCEHDGHTSRNETENQTPHMTSLPLRGTLTRLRPAPSGRYLTRS